MHLSARRPGRLVHPAEGFATYIWCNFPEPAELHDYRYIGKGYGERERQYRKPYQRFSPRKRNIVSQHQVISKPFGYRVQELIQSLLVVRDSLRGAREGQLRQLIPLYGQLRSLLTERAKGTKPLLQEVAAVTGRSTDIYAMPDIDSSGLPAHLQKKLI